MTFQDLPTLNAILNSIATVFLTLGYINIRRGKRETHKKFMTAALIASVAFLTSYLIYHYSVPSTPYPHHDWTRPVYFAILIPHIILAALQVPFVVYIVIRAWQGQFEKHRRVARFVWPVWMFVSVTGVIVYLMLYQL